MKKTADKYGNSAGTSTILNSLSIQTNDILNFEQIDDKIIISKSMKKKISLREEFAKYNGDNLAKDFAWDEPRGNEI